MTRNEKIRHCATMFSRGVTLADLAKAVGVSRRTISRWRKSDIWQWQIEILKKEG